MSAASVAGPDAIVVGAGPNGLAAAIELARNGKRVRVVEGGATIGGGSRSAELTLPGFVHDVCSAIHPLAIASPFFQTVPLREHGVELVHPEVPLAHPLDDGSAAVLHRSVDQTADAFGGRDAHAYRKLMGPAVEHAPWIVEQFFGPLRPPRHPIALGLFGLKALRTAEGLAKRFEGERPRALLGGIGAHAVVKLDQLPSGAVGLVLGALAHAVGWPAVRGGSQALVDALASYLRSLGGEIETGRYVRSVDELPPAKAYLFDVTPRQLLDIAGDRLPARYRAKLARYRYGPGVYKVDYALDGPVPWTAPECAGAGTVHLGGRFEEVAASEQAAADGEHHPRPFVLGAQQSAFDDTRAPAGQHTVWAYCHAPHASTDDASARIEAQIKRFAPGFGARVLARHTADAAKFEAYNPNYVGGDIGGGVADMRQLFARPVLRLSPYRTPADGIYLCSSSTPPGGGVHGMCGFYAARAALAHGL